MIEEFRSFLEVYKTRRLNGVELVEDGDDWIERLLSCVLSRPATKEISLISQTFTKFLDLMETALKLVINLKLYAQKAREASDAIHKYRYIQIVFVQR